MTTGSAAAHEGGVALLERALASTLGSLQLVTPDSMARPTPCDEWDVRALLAHMTDSLRALHETIAVGHLGLDPEAVDCGDGPDPSSDPVGALRCLGCSLLGSWTRASEARAVTVEGRSLTSSIVAAAGAVEVAVHGWDVARACGHDRPVPAGLADELLDLCPLIVTDDDRTHRFRPSVAVSPQAAPGDRLLAFLGRDSAPRR
jgi:uncharacterized protein (TIGR03086 family)